MENQGKSLHLPENPVLCGAVPDSPEREVGPKAAAELIGVHVDSLKKWTEDGLIPCFRTPGGHRRYRVIDLEEFRARRTQVVKPEAEAS